jgi:hypothetical protein
MSLFLSSEDYIISRSTSEAKEVVLYIGKKIYSAWANAKDADKILQIQEIINSEIENKNSKYNNLPFDYSLILAAIDIINDLHEENKYIKENLSKIKMESDFKVRQEQPKLFENLSLLQKNQNIISEDDFIEILEVIKSNINDI